MKLILSLVVLVANVALAELLYVTCEAPELVYIHKMSFEGYIEVRGETASMTALVDYKKAGYSAASKSDVVDVSGKMRVFSPGEMAVHKVTHFALVDNSSDAVFSFANILIDHPTPMASFLRHNDGYTYRATCSATDAPL